MRCDAVRSVAGARLCRRCDAGAGSRLGSTEEGAKGRIKAGEEPSTAGREVGGSIRQS